LFGILLYKRKWYNLRSVRWLRYNSDSLQWI
jgi:hypothetical protein